VLFRNPSLRVAGVPCGNRTGVKLTAGALPGYRAEPCALQAQTPKQPNRHGRYPVGCRRACDTATPAPWLLAFALPLLQILESNERTERARSTNQGVWGSLSAACLLDDAY